jgi:hypothetical protein
MNRLIKASLGEVVLVASGLVTVPAMADDARPTIDGRTLGITEVILNYCASIDPASADKYRRQVRMLTQGASETALAEVRSSEAYQTAHASMEEFVSKVDEHNAKKVCSESINSARQEKAP